MAKMQPRAETDSTRERNPDPPADLLPSPAGWIFSQYMFYNCIVSDEKPDMKTFTSPHFTFVSMMWKVKTEQNRNPRQHWEIKENYSVNPGKQQKQSILS